MHMSRNSSANMNANKPHNNSYVATRRFCVARYPTAQVNQRTGRTVPRPSSSVAKRFVAISFLW